MTEQRFYQDVVCLEGHEQMYGMPTSDMAAEPAGRIHVGAIMPWVGAVNARDSGGTLTNQVQVYSSYIGQSAEPVTQPQLSPDIPDGWLLCDGSVYNRVEYPDLWALIYDDQPSWSLSNGTDANRFAVPDMQMRFPIGAGIYRKLGEDDANTVVAARALLHVHGVTGTHDHGSAGLTISDFTHNTGSSAIAGASNRMQSPATHGAGSDHNVIGTSGARAPGTTAAVTNATLWPYLMVNFLIKALV